MPSFTDADHKLSMRISPRARDGKEEERDMRSLLVHRLRRAPKAVLRVSNSLDLATADPDDYSLYCEGCDRWFSPLTWGDEVTCPGCGQVYVAEVIVYSLVD